MFLSPTEIAFLAFMIFASAAFWIIKVRALSQAAQRGAEWSAGAQSPIQALVEPASPGGPFAPQLQQGRYGCHLIFAPLIITGLAISVGIAWIVFGQAAMPWVRIATIGMLLASFYIIVVIAVLVFVSTSRPTSQPPGTTQTLGFDPAQQTEYVARLTQRFCPRCRGLLAADAPEGLCPACLLAGGLATDAGAPGVNGLAATTPPGNAAPQHAGEWGNLASHFPQLEILELLGRGGMGAVYKARQKHLDRIVALKVIPPEAANDPAFAERFAREARALARLNHPNIVTVYDFGQAGDVYFLLMEYVDGVNLRHAQQASRLEPSEALAIVPQICDALQYAHDQGVVHRDIKPENILLDRSGRVMIADFGLAKLLGGGPDLFTLTHTQQVMGTPRYMAPEQIEKPTSVDHRADIYSLGVVLYEMLTGELPLGRFQPPSQKVQIDVRIDEVVLRTLEKEPERRYQRASEVKSGLASAGVWNAPENQAFANRPAWQTPAPASESEPSQHPGGVPLNLLLAVAIGMVLGFLMIAGGLAIGIYAITTVPAFDGAWWGWMGAAFGCVMGGFGSAAGSYNTYRQLGGAVDLMRAPQATWFDGAMRAFLVLGMLLVCTGAGASLSEQQPGRISYGFLLLGGIMALQGAGVVFWRMLLRPTFARLNRLSGDSFRRLRGAAAGLMITGLLGLAVCALYVGGTLGHTPPFTVEHPFVQSTVFFALLLSSFTAPISLLITIGGWKMWNHKWHGLALRAAVLAMLPCTAGWFLGLPLGIWALVVLLDPKVRATFEEHSTDKVDELPLPQPRGLPIPVAFTIGLGILLVVVLLCGGLGAGIYALRAVPPT